MLCKLDLSLGQHVDHLSLARLDARSNLVVLDARSNLVWLDARLNVVQLDAWPWSAGRGVRVVEPRPWSTGLF